MSGEVRFPAKVGFDLAILLMGWLMDVVERIEIAGSLRRDKPDLGDVELVMMPLFKETHNLFGEPVGKINLLDQRCDEMLSMGLVQKRLNKNGHAIAWGGDGRYKAMLVNGIPVDLFIVLPDRQWGPTMLIRSGPGSANQVLVTTDGIKNAEGNTGILPKRMIWEDGALWQDGKRVNTPEEKDVFKAVGLPYIPPYQRDVKTYQYWAGLRAEYGERIAGKGQIGYGYAEAKYKPAPTWGQFTGADYPEMPDSSYLDIAPGLKLTVDDFVGTRVAVLGISGAGKSNTVAVLGEELAGKIPMTIVDMESEYHSLRDEHPFIVAGMGEHVDRVIGVGDAAKLAREIMNSGDSIILDMLQFRKDERNELLRVYFETLWEIELKARKPHLIVLEEAHMFIPQSGKTDAQEIFTTVALRGRKRGVSIILASQRAAMIDKDVLTQMDKMILHLVQYPTDIGTYLNILPMKKAESAGMIKALSVGQAIVRRPGVDGKQRADVYDIRKRHSKDLGATPKLERQQALEPMA